MATDFENNYYVPEEVKGYNSQNYAYTPNQPGAPSMSIQNAQSLNDIPHKYIKQINSSEFFINYKTNRWPICLFILVSAGFIAILIIALLYAPDENKSVGGIIFGIIFCGFLFALGVFGFVFDPASLTFYLEQDSIRIKIIRNCCCLQKNTILRRGDIQLFDVELFERGSIKSKSIFYINKNGEKKYLIGLDFFGDEAAYLVYVLNRHMGIEMSTNNLGLGLS